MKKQPTEKTNTGVFDLLVTAAAFVVLCAMLVVAAVNVLNHFGP